MIINLLTQSTLSFDKEYVLLTITYPKPFRIFLRWLFYFYIMMRIGVLADTHGFLDDAIFKHFDQCNEIWHVGDFGSIDVVEALQGFKPLRAVYGNIDGQEIRTIFPEINIFMCENVKVMMKHIGGYPPKYNPETKKQIIAQKPLLFISGHSHILKIMYDDVLQCLHINPGAAGKQGWHKIKTIVRFSVDGSNIKNCDVVELGTIHTIA